VRRAARPKVLLLGVKPDADIRMFDCEMNGCDTRSVDLDALPSYPRKLWNGVEVDGMRKAAYPPV
jgi:hypothetical protein